MAFLQTILQHGDYEVYSFKPTSGDNLVTLNLCNKKIKFPNAGVNEFKEGRNRGSTSYEFRVMVSAVEETAQDLSCNLILNYGKKEDELVEYASIDSCSIMQAKKYNGIKNELHSSNNIPLDVTTLNEAISINGTNLDCFQALNINLSAAPTELLLTVMICYTNPSTIKADIIK